MFKLNYHKYQLLLFQASPAFFILIALEFIIASLKGKQTLRANDGITSVSAGVNSRLIRLVQLLFLNQLVV